MSRKYIPLLVGGLVALLLALILGYWLFSAWGHYQEENSALAQSGTRLTRLTGRPTFPSTNNVETLTRQVSIYDEYLEGLYQAMSEGQRPPEPINRDRFRQLLEQTLRRLVQTARAKSITLPPDFAFGFQRYAAGAPPEQKDLERLVDQLRSVAMLCSVMYEAGIGELVSVERMVFEEAQAAPVEEEYGGRRGRSREEPAEVVKSTDLVRDPDGLFTRERYVVSYRAQDDANWKILEHLARGSPFVVVSKVEITNTARPAVVPPAPAEPLAEAAPRTSVAATSGWQSPGAARPAGGREAPAILPRELRVVAGQELPLVRLEVDVYRFAQEASDAEGEENP